MTRREIVPTAKDINEARMERKARSYIYKAVVCTACGWRGRRGFNVTWPACPDCGAPGHKAAFLDAAAQGREPHGGKAA